MDTNKAAYWIALGVLVISLNSDYRQGKFVALHQVADRADALLCRISTRAEQTLAAATGLTGRAESSPDDLLASTRGAEIAGTQVDLLREQVRDEAEMIRDQVQDQVRDRILAQADTIRARAEMRRAQIEQMRSSTLSRFGLARTDVRADVRAVGRIDAQTEVHTDVQADAHGVTFVCPKTGKRASVQTSTYPADSADVDADIVDAH